MDRAGTGLAACIAAAAACAASMAYQEACKLSEEKRLMDQIQEIQSRERDLQKLLDDELDGNSCRPGCGSPDVQLGRLQQEEMNLSKEYAKVHQFDGPKGHPKTAAWAALAALVCAAVPF